MLHRFFLNKVYSKKKLVGLICLLFFNQQGFSQCDSLINLINSELPHQVKVDKIGLFVQNLDSSNTTDSADCFHDLGFRWYYKNWQHSQLDRDINNAIKYTSLAVKLKRSEKLLDTFSLRRSLYNLGFFLQGNHKIYESLNIYREIANLSLKDDFQGYTKNELGLLLVEIGEFKDALNQFHDVISFSKKNEEHWELLLLSYINITDCYARMNYKENKDSIGLYINKAKTFIEKEKLVDSYEDIQIKILEANLFLETKKFRKAINGYKNLIRSNVLENDISKIVYNNLGFCLLRSGDTIQAKLNLLESIKLDSAYSDPYENLGDLSLEKGNFTVAMNYYDKAIQLATNSYNNSKNNESLPDSKTLELASNKLTLLNHLTVKANGWLRYYQSDFNITHLNHALNTFKKADELIDIIKRENTEFQSKVYWREQSSELYANAVETCFLLKRPEEAFYYMERNKALLLLEDLSNEDAKQIANIPTEKAQQEFNLKRAIFLSENKLQEQKGLIDNDSLEVLKTTIRNNKYNYEKFIDSLEVSYPNYAKFKKKVDVLPLNDLQTKYITEDKATLHYILNEEDGYGLLTTTDTTLLFHLKNIPKINEEVELLIAALADGVSGIDNFTTISNKVFQDLIPEKVYHKIKGKQLTIIPDYTLQQIPFESLVIDSTNLKYLFEEVEIGYAYSASLLHHNQKTAQHSDIDLLGVAPIVFNDLKLPELFFSKNEVKNIAEVFPSTILLNNEATKTNFIENVANHSVLHLATHADIGDGENPWVAFSDSKMYLKEIYATKNQADMVVLSGCNTSNGALKRGEGVMSLARGFFYSGAKSVVSTLWPVSDEAGKEILINFYKNLNEGLTKSKALQKAKLAYLKNTEEKELKHPYYWAGYVALGDNSPLTDEPISNWQFLVYTVIGSGILILGYTKVKRHRAAA